MKAPQFFSNILLCQYLTVKYFSVSVLTDHSVIEQEAFTNMASQGTTSVSI